MYFPILKEILQVGSCPDCQSVPTIKNYFTKLDLFYSLKIKCTSSSFEYCTFKSNTMDKNTQNKDRSAFDNNLRTFVALHKVGQGFVRLVKGMNQ
jgi:hypothetical protein